MSADPRRRPLPPPPPPPPPEAEPDTNTPAMQPDTASPAPPQSNGLKPGQQPEEGGFKLKFCTVCASNNNRSMEAHLRLTSTPQHTTYPTISFGTGSLVRLPGPSISLPNVYNFNNTSYASMYNELLSKDARLYRANGILPMLERNKGVKWGPERWQDWRVGVPRVGKRPTSSADPTLTTPEGGQSNDGEAEYKSDRGYEGTEAGVVDIVITCEERCWDAVLDDLLTRGAPLNRPVHVFNVDIKDNHEEALVGGKAILELADELNAAAAEERKISAVNGVGGFDAGNAAARQGFDERVPEILAGWQERWPQLPALWTLAWF